MRARNLHPQVLLAAWWTRMQLGRARLQLAAGGLDALDLSPPPPLPERARPGVAAILHRRGATCLARAAIWQAWEVAHGRRRDLVVGVTAPSAGFRAHAWLDGEGRCHEASFTELTRRRAPG